jgi:hypothetical protein
MGAQQSTGAGGGAGGGGGSGEIKTSYYELLGVERTATDDECVSRNSQQDPLLIHAESKKPTVERPSNSIPTATMAIRIARLPSSPTSKPPTKSSLTRKNEPGTMLTKATYCGVQRAREEMSTTGTTCVLPLPRTLHA